MYENDMNNVPNDTQPGKGAAIASLVLGIVSVIFWFFGAGALIGLITGIIGLIGSALIFVACVACVGALGTAGLLSNM